jgi:hypothetical protein
MLLLLEPSSEHGPQSRFPLDQLPQHIERSSPSRAGIIGTAYPTHTGDASAALNDWIVASSEPETPRASTCALMNFGWSAAASVEARSSVIAETANRKVLIASPTYLGFPSDNRSRP